MLNLIHALVFVLNTVLGVFTGAVLLRFLMQQTRADFYNPLGQAVMKLTNPLLMPVRRLVPPWNRVDMAALVLVVVLQLCNVLLVTFLASLLPGHDFYYGPWYLISWTGLKLVYILLNLYFLTILFEVLSSWLGQGRGPLDGVLRPVNGPLLRPVRQLLPPLGGLDFSPLVVMLLIQVIDYYALPQYWPLMGL